MDSKDHYVKECLVSKPPKMGNLASHSHERIKNKKMKQMKWKKKNSKVSVLLYFVPLLSNFLQKAQCNLL